MAAAQTHIAWALVFAGAPAHALVRGTRLADGPSAACQSAARKAEVPRRRLTGASCSGSAGSGDPGRARVEGANRQLPSSPDLAATACGYRALHFRVGGGSDLPYAAMALDGEVEYQDPSRVFALARASLGLDVTPAPSLGLEVLGGYPFAVGIPRRCEGAGAASPYLEGLRPPPGGFAAQIHAVEDLQLLIAVVGLRAVIGPRSRRWGRGSTVLPMAQAGLRYLRTWDADAVERSLANTEARVHSASNPLRQRSWGSAHVTALLTVVPTARRVGGGVSVELGRVVTLASLRLMLVVGVGHNAAAGFTARMGVQLAPQILAVAQQPRAAVPRPAGGACLCWQAP